MAGNLSQKEGIEIVLYFSGQAHTFIPTHLRRDYEDLPVVFKHDLICQLFPIRRESHIADTAEDRDRPCKHPAIQRMDLERGCLCPFNGSAHHGDQSRTVCRNRETVCLNPVRHLTGG